MKCLRTARKNKVENCDDNEWKTRKKGKKMN